MVLKRAPILVLAGLIAIATAGCSSGGNKATSDITATTLLTAEQIAEAAKDPNAAEQILDKNTTFYALLERATMQPLVGVVRERSDKVSGDKDPTTDITYFDYATKLVSNQQRYTGSTLGAQYYRCVDGVRYVSSERSPAWRVDLGNEKDRGTSLDPCGIGQLQSSINDGFSTGGLTAAQAATFVSELERRKGLLTVDDLQVVDKNGKRYIRFAVTLKPIKLKGDKDHYWGGQNLMWAFKETEIDPETHPYTYTGAGGQGMKIVYYVDAASQLPAYFESVQTPVLDKDGKEVIEEDDFRSHQRVQYSYGVPVPKPAVNDPLPNFVLGWPAEL